MPLPSAVTVTPSNVAVFRIVASWLVTTRPISAFAAVSVDVPTVCHVTPSLDTDPVTLGPLRTNFTHVGADCGALANQVVAAPVPLRVMNSTPPVGRTSSTTCAAFAAADSRIITPAFANGCVFARLTNRATNCPSPLSGWFTYWNPSLVPQMSAPAPRTVNVPAPYDALPACPVAPTS